MERRVRWSKLPGLRALATRWALATWGLLLCPQGLSGDLELAGGGICGSLMPGVCEQVAWQSNEDIQSNALIAESKKNTQT